MAKTNNKLPVVLRTLRKVPLQVSYEQVVTWVGNRKPKQGKLQQRSANWLAYWIGRERKN